MAIIIFISGPSAKNHTGPCEGIILMKPQADTEQITLSWDVIGLLNTSQWMLWLVICIDFSNFSRHMHPTKEQPPPLYIPKTYPRISLL